MLAAAIDNDILLKAACYRLLESLIAMLSPDTSKVGVLGSARFVCLARLAKIRLSQDPTEIANLLESLLGRVTPLEPTSDEARFAAEIEFAAQQAHVSLDIGESQLCAIVIARNIGFLVSGDKRAIFAMETLLAHRAELAKLAGRVVCLEQVIKRIIGAIGAIHIRSAVCKEIAVDRALSICFGCASSSGCEKDWVEGLDSYINDLSKRASTVLATS
jgi:hypothetical protein